MNESIEIKSLCKRDRSRDNWVGFSAGLTRDASEASVVSRTRPKDTSAVRRCQQ